MQTCKLFADLERLRQEREAKDMHERSVRTTHAPWWWNTAVVIPIGRTSLMFILHDVTRFAGVSRRLIQESDQPRFRSHVKFMGDFSPLQITII